MRAVPRNCPTATARQRAWGNRQAMVRQREKSAMSILRCIVMIQLLAGVLAVNLEARSVGAGWWPRAIYSEVVARARENSELQNPAFVLLQTAAEGRAEQITAVMLRPFGIETKYIEIDAMNSLAVRGLAYLAIGKLSDPRALVYLENIQDQELSDQERMALSGPIRDAVYMARLAQFPDPERRAQFLIEIVRTKRKDKFAMVPARWAEDELCRAGELVFLSEVEASIASDAPSRRDEGRSLLCREKMRLVTSQPDRTAALASALRSKTTLENDALLSWVIAELIELRTKESWAVLSRFVDETKQTHGQALYQLPISRQVDYIELCLTTRFGTAPFD